MRPLILFLLTCIALLYCAHLAAQNTEITLLPRSQIAIPETAFNEAESRWLAGKTSLTIGVWGNSHPPILMGYDNTLYEGIGADYAWVVSRVLNKKIRVFHFDNIDEAKLSLLNGNIDMLAYITSNLASNSGLLFTQPYLLDDGIVLHKRNHQDIFSVDDETSHRMAFVDDYNTTSFLLKLFPHAMLQKFSYYSEAIAAVEYGAVDSLWVNSATATYFLNLNGDKSTIIKYPQQTSNLNVSFAVTENNAMLKAILDKIIGSLPLHSRMRIAKNWGLDSRFVIKHNPLVLSSSELNWISHQRRVSVNFPMQQAPLSFNDSDGNPSGYLVTLLRIISERTGLEFVANSAAPDLHAVIINPKDAGSGQTRSYAISPWVLVNHAATKRQTLDQLAGKRVLITGDSALLAQLKQDYPNVHFSVLDEPFKALEQLAARRVDAVIMVKLFADYAVNAQFPWQLIISSTVSVPPAHFVMHVSDPASPLLSILNKALIDISPQIQQQYLSSWFTGTLSGGQMIWDTYSRLLLQVALGCILVVLLIIMRNRYLKKEIRNRTRYEKRLEDQLRFIQTLIDESPVALYVRDSQMRMVQCNNTYLQYFGGDAACVTGKTLEESGILSPESVEEFKDIYSHTLSSATPSVSRREIHTLAGVRVLIQHWTLPYRDHSGAIQGIIGGFIDVTEQDRLLDELQLARIAADQASQSKSLFLAQMSHEIRTPLNALIGLLEIEHKHLSDPAQRDENIRVAWQASRSLLALVGNILDMAKIEAGTHRVRLMPMSLKACLNSVIALFQHAANEKRIVLSFEAKIAQASVLFDQTMLTQIASNLISNAIKFTDSGTVRVQLRERKGFYVGSSRYVLTVKDSGPGMTPEQTLRIFEPFIQADDTARNALGTGLGLSICKQLAKLLNSNLCVESEPGKGSVFRFSFAATHCTNLPNDAQTDAKFHHNIKGRALMVDDHAPNRLLLSQQLSVIGYDVVAAENAEQALVCWDNAAGLFDLIITDCNMPGMDGFNLTRVLRDKEQQRNLPARPIIGLTAMAEQDVREKGLQAGMTECLFKPLEVEKLCATVAAHVTPTKSSSVETKTVLPPEIAHLKKLSGGDSALFERLSTQLVEANKEDIAQLHQTILACDAQAIYDSAHRLLGTARIIGSSTLAIVCRELELSANSVDVEYLSALYLECLSEIRSIERAFHNYSSLPTLN